MIDERRYRRTDEIADGLHALCGVKARVWWDNDSMQWRCRWREQELTPQSDSLNEQIINTWRNEIRETLLRSP